MNSPPNEDRLQQVLDEAGSIAARSGTSYCSGHLLMALVALKSSAQTLLTDRGLTTTLIVEHLGSLQEGAPEATDMMNSIRDRGRRLAQSCGSSRVTTLHLLLVLCTLRESLAHRIMVVVGIDLASLRNVALALVTGGPGRDGAVPPKPRPRVLDSQATTGEPATDTGETPEAVSEAGAEREPAPAEEPQPAEPQAPAQRSRMRRADRPRLDPRVTRGKQQRSDEDAGEDQAQTAALQYTLDPDQYPTLAAMGRNVSEAAAQGKLEPLVGRMPLVEKILDILGKRRANNPCLVGEPGVGKTAIVEGLAYLQVNTPDEVPLLAGRLLLELNMGSLLSGTGLRGSFSERMSALRDEVQQAEGRIIVFLDEIHTLVGAGAVGDGALDAVGELSAAMARGSFPCIGATTTDNYKKHIEETPLLQRRLQPVLVPEPTLEEALEILKGVMPAYAEHHEVTFLSEAYDAAARLSSRYIADRFLPDKAISLLDLAGSRARRRGKQQVGRDEVAELVAEQTKIPVDRLLMTDTERFLHMEDFMHLRIIGHEPIMTKVCQVIRRNYAGFSSDRPIGSFLFLGPTGVGKTETVKVLADFLFQSREALCRFDMSEFQEPHSVARLIGSPPGYVGHDQGGQLTESVRRRPYQIVLLDEVEKAHPDVLQVLLQLLDDGRLTDGRGRTVDFSNTVVVMTSNLGSKHYDRRKGSIGFGPAEKADDDDDPDWPGIAEEVLTTARKAFPIELWNRIEERLVFRPLSKAQVLKVARLLVKDSSDRLETEKDIGFEATEAALEYLIDHGGYDRALGARPMRTTIQRLIEAPVAEQILLHKVDEGDRLRVDCVDGRLIVEKQVDEELDEPESDG